MGDELPVDPGSTISDEVILKSIDGHQLSISRRLLAAESGYFRALFSGNFRDSWKPGYNLQFSGEILTALIDGINKDLAQEVPIWSLPKSCDLLSPLTFLQMDRLLPHLQKSITSQVDVANLIRIYRYSIQRDLVLAKQLWEILLRHFNKLTEAEEYLKMTPDELVKAMVSEKLNVESKMETVVLGNYVVKNPGPQSQKVQQLRNNLRHTGDGVGHPVVMNRIPREVILYLGGWCNSGPTDIVEVFNPRNERWYRAEFLQNDRRAYHTFTRQGNRLYVAGGMNGREYFRTVSYYDLDIRQWDTSTSDMVERRCYGSSISIPFTDGTSQLMVIGGYNGIDRLASCELIAPTISGWRHAKPMTKPRSDAAAVLVNDGVICLGGFDGRNVHQDAELFDVATNSWSSLNRRMLHARTGVAAVALNQNTFLVAGGFNGTARLSTVEFYDTREGRWHALPRMHTTRSNFALEHMNGEVYAVGGFDGATTTALCERFDMVAQHWTKIPDISVPRSALKVVRLADHDIVRELIRFNEDQ